MLKPSYGWSMKALVHDEEVESLISNEGDDGNSMEEGATAVMEARSDGERRRVM